jgi:hypothetical protein
MDLFFYAKPVVATITRHVFVGWEDHNDRNGGDFGSLL